MRPTDAHFRRLERMYALAPINDYFRPELRVSEARAEVTLAVKPDFFHAAGAVHGAVYFKVLDDAAFFAVASIVTDVFVLTAGFTVHFTRPITGGSMHAVGRVVHRSKQIFIADAELFDGDGKLAGRGTGTFMRSRVTLESLEGYD
jgi:uncharacterized protein (TIGR00369 family)